MDASRHEPTSSPTSAPIVPETSQLQESISQDSTPLETTLSAPSSPEPSVSSVEQPDTSSESQPRASTLPPTEPIVPAEEVEHAYWAEFEEDTSRPDAEEMKEINNSDQDYSACDRRFHPKYRDESGKSGRGLINDFIRYILGEQLLPGLG